MADETLVLSKAEAELAAKIAKSRGITIEEAAELIVKKSIAHRVRMRTGKGPARMYGYKKR
jgi:hypothetical protein